MPAAFTGAAARPGERRFGDSVKTMVSGEASFAINMSFQASLIGRNNCVAYPPQRPRPPKKYFPFLKNKVRATTSKTPRTPCQRTPNKNVANT
ncbi:MAG: hypothetical protein RR376_06415 [Janthinobacterium sp.]